MLNVENVSLHYGAAQALRDVSFKAEMGKITCVLGRNGVGKSSLLRAVTGQHPVTSGTISFNGAPLDGMAPFRRAKQGVGYVPQGREIFPLLRSPTISSVCFRYFRRCSAGGAATFRAASSSSSRSLALS